jgi:uncharacterized UBP type Zn finger protein
MIASELLCPKQRSQTTNAGTVCCIGNASISIVAYSCSVLLFLFHPSEIVNFSAYTHSGCGKKADAIRSTSLAKLPDVLLITFVRTVYTARGTVKVTTPVTFPVTGLDLKPYLAEDHEEMFSMSYDLSSMIVHDGLGAFRFLCLERKKK